MRFCSLGSGSRGNAHIIEKGDTTLLIECGFAARSLIKRLSERYISPAEITAALISHEHKDHVAGLALLQRYHIPCYMSAGTAAALEYPANWQCLYPGVPVTINELTVCPLPVPHDAADPLQFVIDDGARTIAVFTDLGYVSAAVRRACANTDALVIECNYDKTMLQQGDYPQVVKDRIAGKYGHLSNHCAAALVEQTKPAKSGRQIIGAHVSENNNNAELAQQALSAADSSAAVYIASQNGGTEWITIS